ncbi:hypothetical protein K402DRAFT_393364 [Aulographum hederae CBS 113979]|uniref:Uncharacterized protein n=1 Tax=Aulographum hederae CBS 113979 TaxID=1176131 RepID=A0A6G1H114_9PEZI|nr:hypothetical protein K402DRAFT_393364 [Aulographum hederae CBS 113979]
MATHRILELPLRSPRLSTAPPGPPSPPDMESLSLDDDPARPRFQYFVTPPSPVHGEQDRSQMRSMVSTAPVPRSSRCSQVEADKSQMPKSISPATIARPSTPSRVVVGHSQFRDLVSTAPIPRSPRSSHPGQVVVENSQMGELVSTAPIPRSPRSSLPNQIEVDHSQMRNLVSTVPIPRSPRSPRHEQAEGSSSWFSLRDEESRPGTPQQASSIMSSEHAQREHPELSTTAPETKLCKHSLTSGGYYNMTRNSAESEKKSFAELHTMGLVEFDGCKGCAELEELFNKK